MQITVGIKYCGHCNPQQEGPELVKQLKQGLPEVKTVKWSEVNYDLLLVISACPSNCVEQPVFNGPRIEIAAKEIVNWQIPPGHLAERVMLKCLQLGLQTLRPFNPATA